MAQYLAQRIIDEKFTYNAVIAKYPQLKTDIDAYLVSKDRKDLIAQ